MYEECNGAEKYYFYDSNGVISGIRYFDANGNMTMIYVVTNSQGDVIALYDKNGNAVVEYQYDAWGNIVSVINSTEGSNLDWNEINPFRYRGYVYDSETGLYYLQSRYYDAEVGRFLNADGLVSTGTGLLGYNMFAYCDNNPVNREDSTGKLWKIVVAVATIVTAVVAVVNTAKNAIIDATPGVMEAEKKVAKKDPIGAIKGLKAQSIATEYQQQLYPNTYQSDANQANAFLHAMWNAVMTDKIGEKRAKKFADAHEEAYMESHPIYCEMDFHNNELGRQIAVEYAGQGYDVFAQRIQESINEGEAYVIAWDKGN